jgi:hypothetical protein
MGGACSTNGGKEVTTSDNIDCYSKQVSRLLRFEEG